MKKKLFMMCTIFILGTGTGIGCGSENTGKIQTGSGQNHDFEDVGLNIFEPSDVGTDVEEDTTPQIRTLADYERCSSDSDCREGLGSCVKEIALNRADADGLQSVAIGEVFEELGEGEGICTVVCTNNPDACADLSVNGLTSDAVPHVCQLVVQGEAPYPGVVPAFPFGDVLVPAAQAAGQVFGSICRPPFELHAAVADSMCATCEGPDRCGGSDSICWSLLNKAAAKDGESGTCLSACSDDSQCALGFVCDAVDEGGQGYCRPTLDTCTVCRDLDGDGFGTGRCGDEDAPVTAHDCDDTNPLAYFDADNMDHPFPAHCGEQDFNCNGLSDAAEQIGAESFPEEHCTSCFDTCEGTLPGGQRACQNRGSLEAPEPTCVAQCERDANGKMLFADCDGDISNGCETPTDDISRQYYRDKDGDGYGDPNDVVFACGANVAPVGYVNNNLDCNDNSAAVKPGAAEICDGLDNNCDGQIDDGLSQVGTTCSTGLAGVCSVGVWQCGGVQGFQCVPNITPKTQAEVCGDGLDNNCDGKVNESWPQDGTVPPAASHYNAYYRDADNDGYPASHNSPIYACTKPAGYALKRADGKLDCDDNNSAVNPGAAEVCGDGIDNNCDGLIDDQDPSAQGMKTWYRDLDGDGYGMSSSSYDIRACVRPVGYSDQPGDCNDNDAAISPAAIELCDGIDNNCNGYVDETFPTKGSSCTSSGVGICVQPGVYVCDPVNPTQVMCNANAGAPTFESCNGKDDNCNGRTDEGCPVNASTLITGPISTRGEVGFLFNETDVRTYFCKDNQVMVGARVYQETSFDDIQRINLFCRDIKVNQTLAYSYNTTHAATEDVVYGPQYSYKTYKERYGGEFHCPDGAAVSEVKVRKDTHHITWIEFTCRSLAFSTQPGQVAVSTTLTRGPSNVEASYGNATNGTLQHPSPALRCQDDEVAVGFRASPDKNDNGSDALTYLSLRCKKISAQTIN